jgi:hypothetical protein
MTSKRLATERKLRAPSGVGGWLATLCAVLLVWQPFQLALNAASALQALPLRGASLAWVLALRLLVAAFGIAAGLTLIGRRPAAVALAKTSLVASAITDTFVYMTGYVPSNRLPGDEVLLVSASLLYYGAWIVYLIRSRRVRNTFSRWGPDGP